MKPGELRTAILALDPFFEHAEGRRASRVNVAAKSNPMQAAAGGSFAMANRKSVAPGAGAGAGSGLVGGERAKAEAAARRISTLIRVAGQAPEVMVKVTGRNQDVRGVRGHLLYLARDKEAEAELDNGQRIQGRAAIGEAAALFDEPMLRGGRADNGDIAVHVMFSMPQGTPAEQVLDAARATSAQIFEGHQYVLVLHTDKGHPHVHAVVSARDEQGRKLRHYKPQVQAWRESFAGHLRARGVLAEATSRELRGVVRKPVSRPVREIRDQRKRRARAGMEAGPMAKTDAQKMLEVLREIERAAAGATLRPVPWEGAVRMQRERVVEGWRRAAALMRSQDIPDAERGAQAMTAFVAAMPPVRFERDEIEAVLREGRAFAMANRINDGEPGQAVRRGGAGGGNTGSDSGSSTGPRPDEPSLSQERSGWRRR